jgi:hypothetical protein
MSKRKLPDSVTGVQSSGDTKVAAELYYENGVPSLTNIILNTVVADGAVSLRHLAVQRDLADSMWENIIALHSVLNNLECRKKTHEHVSASLEHSIDILKQLDLDSVQQECDDLNCRCSIHYPVDFVHGAVLDVTNSLTLQYQCHLISRYMMQQTITTIKRSLCLTLEQVHPITFTLSFDTLISDLEDQLFGWHSRRLHPHRCIKNLHGLCSHEVKVLDILAVISGISFSSVTRQLSWNLLDINNTFEIRKIK